MLIRLCVSLLVVATATVAAQQGFVGMIQPRARYPTAEALGRGFTFCRAMYTSSGAQREVGGQGWSTDYPDADRNISIRLAEMTKVRVGGMAASGEPDHFVVPLSGPELFQCPYLHMEDVGAAALAPAEVEGLRTYLLKGGFLWVDDFWGSAAWDTWTAQIERVLPPSHYPISDIPPGHPILRTQFTLSHVSQIPSIQFWNATGGHTSERGADSREPHFRGITDDHGRLMVVMTHNTDISDAWEREGEDPRFFFEFSPQGYSFGINVLLYALTQ